MPRPAHLSYVGDAEIGEAANLGAGTITCNYDGVNKHRTVIGAEAFIGSNTSLVAPVQVGAGATVGAGSVLTQNAPEGQLTAGPDTAAHHRWLETADKKNPAPIDPTVWRIGPGCGILPILTD